MSSELETRVRALTVPINNQYPRPWLTDATDIEHARVFTVGRNQRNGFLVDAVGSHDRYIDALFNRGEMTCRQLYDHLTGAPSPTRRNTDRLVEHLGKHGVFDVIQTNVVCYATPMSADLRRPQHKGGEAAGTDLFRTIFGIIKPRVLIAHGAKTTQALSQVLGAPLPKPPIHPGTTSRTPIGETEIWVVPSLAPPAYMKWQRWADEHLELIAVEVAALLKR